MSNNEQTVDMPSMLPMQMQQQTVMPDVVESTDADAEETVQTVTPEMVESTDADAEESAPLRPPRLPFPLTAGTLFQLAVRLPDPLRYRMGFFYEGQLQRECKYTFDYPIYQNDIIGINSALWRRWNNPQFFQCQAIDLVLRAYWMQMDSAMEHPKGMEDIKNVY